MNRSAGRHVAQVSAPPLGHVPPPLGHVPPPAPRLPPPPLGLHPPSSSPSITPPDAQPVKVTDVGPGLKVSVSPDRHQVEEVVMRPNLTDEVSLPESHDRDSAQSEEGTRPDQLVSFSPTKASTTVAMDTAKTGSSPEFKLEGVTDKNEQKKPVKISFSGAKRLSGSRPSAATTAIRIVSENEPVLKKHKCEGSLSRTVAKAFANESDDDEEEMPREARLRMRNLGKDTPTSSGPNSFNKTAKGFVDVRGVWRKSN